MNKQFLAVLISLTLIFSGCSKDDDPKNEDTPKSNDKEITSFTFASLNPAKAGVIDQSLKTIKVTDISGDADITSLVPTIVVSAKATVSPASGTAKDFTGPVVYSVTAENGTTTTYTVTVTQGALTISGSMTANKTLTDRLPGDAIDYIIDGAFNIEGNALLTIDPGVKISFTGRDGWIIVTENAGLKLVGTSDKPIILTGPVNNPNKGAWGGIEFQSNRADNLMQYVTITNAGSTNQGAVYVTPGANMSIKNCLIERSANHGLLVEGTLSAFEKNTIKDCDMAPVNTYDILEGAKIDAESVFTGNALNYIIVNYGFYGSSQSKNLTLKKIAIPYLFKSGIYVEKILTIEPGTTLLFDSSSFIDVGSNTGILNASGTSELPITFSHVDGTIGGWQGITIGTDLDNKLINCVIEYAGSNSNESNIYIDGASKLTISNTIVRKTNGYGIRLYDESIVNASDVTFSACTLGNIYNIDTDVVSTSF